jgi:PAS domain S-box-containing protein
VTIYKSANQTTRAVHAMVMLLAAAIALALPAIYFSLQYQFQRATMDMEAQLNAAAVSDFIDKNPARWQLDTQRLEDLLKDQTNYGMGVRRIVDTQGRVMAQGHEKMDTPVMVIAADLLESGQPVGRFEVVRSLRLLLIQTACVALLGLLLGALALLVLRVYPLRALKRALETLANEKAHAELILNSIDDGVITMDAQGRVLSSNPAAGRIFGYAPGELPGRNVNILMPASDRAGPDFDLARFLGTGEKHRTGSAFEMTARRRDGTLFPLEISISRFYLEGQLRFLGSMRDITERKQARDEVVRLHASLEERVQQRTAQLLVANEQLQAFAFSVSHDLRTPLTSIAGFSGLLARQTHSGPAAERTRHYVARIAAGVTQMGELIDALLKLARLSHVKLQWADVDLSAMAETVLNGYQAGEPGRVVQIDVEPGLVAAGDAQLLRQVLDQLLGNAWKFSNQHVHGRIAFRREVGADKEAVYVVEDNGVGFDMAYSSKLFGSFQRLHTPAEFSGAGMGLVTVQRIITRHGGRVWGESSPGVGARFFFTLGTPPA